MGNTATNVAMSLLAAQVATPLAALLPVLTSALASGRHKERVEAAIHTLERDLEKHRNKLKDVSDAQYKLINEAVLTVFSTLNENKLTYLRRVVINALDENEIEPLEASLLSRVIRDISAEEIKFLFDNFSYQYIAIGGKYKRDDTLTIDENSHAALVASGLFGLGVLMRTEQLTDTPNRYKYSPLCAKLMALTREI